MYEINAIFSHDVERPMSEIFGNLKRVADSIQRFSDRFLLCSQSLHHFDDFSLKYLVEFLGHVSRIAIL